MRTKGSLFKKNQMGLGKLSLFLVLSAVLITLDSKTTLLEKPRQLVHQSLSPVYTMVDVPIAKYRGIRELFSSKYELMTQNHQLRHDQLVLRASMLKLSQLEQENAHLKALLGSAGKLNTNVQVARVKNVQNNRYLQQIEIDSGQNSGAFVGQAVLDEKGVLGLVKDIGNDYAKVLLLTDLNHAVPVYNLRTGMRSIAKGLGQGQGLRLSHVPRTADVQVGDVFVTSGMGERFPRGYPVGKVVKDIGLQDGAFANINLEPMADMQEVRQVLLINVEAQTEMKG